MVPNSVIEKFQSLLLDDDQFNEAVMRVALEVAQSYLAPGDTLDEEGYSLAYDLAGKVGLN